MKIGFGSPWLTSNPPVPPPPPPRQRMTIQGQQLMVGTTPFLPRGCVNGHGELYRAGDNALLAALGARFTREGVRWWGTYGTGYQVDSELDLSPGNINEDYAYRTKTHIQEAVAAGMRVNLFMDSNCGQGIDDGVVCELDGDLSNFFTDSDAARAKRQAFIDCACYIVGQNLGNIDTIEALVEPSVVGLTYKQLWAYQEQFMDAVLAVDPAMLFVIGGLAYFPNQIVNAFNPDWASPYHRFHGKIILTGNFLSNITSNPDLVTSRLQFVVAARTKWNCPVYIQQAGATLADDPDNTLTAALFEAFRLASGGPIGWTFWEQFGTFPNGYAPWSLSNPNDPNSSRVTNAPRLAMLQAAFTA